MKPKLEDELKRFTALRLIALVDKLTDWVSNLVIATKKSGDPRIYIDPKQANKALRQEVLRPSITVQRRWDRVEQEQAEVQADRHNLSLATW